MRMAIVADWLVTFGGAEHVLLELHAAFPQAPMFTSVARTEKLGPLAHVDVRTSRLQRMYELLGNHQVLLPWMPRAMESLDLRGYDVILSSSHAVAKGIVPPSGSVHVCYCHTPMRYAWEMQEQYLDDFRVPKLLRPRIRGKLRDLRRWDLTTAKRVDVFIANSTTTQERIARIYGRESTVIPPPVDDRFFHAPLPHASHVDAPLLAVGRLVPYKRFDLLIEFCNARKLVLWIAGTGQDERRLRALAGPTVRFLGFVPDKDLPALYAGAQALLFPQEEDAGIVLLEAQASGTPAIAYNAGGARDVVSDGTTGVLFDAQTAESLGAAYDRFADKHFDRNHIRQESQRFSQHAFRAAVTAQITQACDALAHGTLQRR